MSSMNRNDPNGICNAAHFGDRLAFTHQGCEPLPSADGTNFELNGETKQIYMRVDCQDGTWIVILLLIFLAGVCGCCGVAVWAVFFRKQGSSDAPPNNINRQFQGSSAPWRFLYFSKVKKCHLFRPRLEKTS